MRKNTFVEKMRADPTKGAYSNPQDATAGLLESYKMVEEAK